MCANKSFFCDEGKRMKLKYVLVMVLCLFAAGNAKAELEIEVAGAQRDPMPIAFPEMIHDGFFVGQYANRIRDVVIADLESSGLFRIINDNSYIQEFSSMDQEPKFVDWTAINAHALVQSSVVEISGNKLRVEFRLWDVPAENQLKGQSFTTTKDNWRRVAHVIADAIYERLTGDKGYFDTRVVYVSESGPVTRRIKRLAIMDQDGENHKFLTSGATMALTPRFSPNLQKVAYISFSSSAPKVYILDLETGKQELVGHFPGMTFAPRFSPDSKKLLLSYANNGRTNIYEMDLERRTSKKLTNSSAIDTSPSYSPEGEQIVFSSDRAGNQQLYVMNNDGSDVKRISRGLGSYATPVWSPNGRVLMYFRQEKGSNHVKLYSIDLTGYNKRQIITPSDASDPAWSPLLP